MAPQEVVDLVLKYKNYFKDKGGVTFSGGEPLYQSEFLLESLKLCKEAGLNTCIDTSGVGGTLNKEVLEYTDLVLLDVKNLDESAFEYMTKGKFSEYMDFVKELNESNTDVWIRQVIVPEVNDTKEYIKSLNKFIKNIKNVSKVELLPYHTMAVNKYKELGLEYRLEGTPAMEKDKLEELKKIVEIG